LFPRRSRRLHSLTLLRLLHSWRLPQGASPEFS